MELAFPIVFLSNPLVYIFLHICLLLKATYICLGAWVLAGLMVKTFGFQHDEVYIGSDEDNEKKYMKDNKNNIHLAAGHLRKLQGIIPKSLNSLMISDIV